MKALNRVEWWYTGLILVGILLRFWHLDARSIWSDELLSMYAAGPHISLSMLVSPDWSDTHPPLYLLLMHLYFKLVPFTVWSGRFLSALFGAAGIGVAYACCRHVASRQSGLAATAILSVHNLHFFYSQELRMYSLVFLCAALVVWAMLKWKTSPSLKISLALGLSLSLLSHIHFFGLIFACSILLVCGMRSIAEGELKKFIPVVLCWLLTVWPTVPYLLFNTGRDSLWTGLASSTDIAAVIVGLSGGRLAAVCGILLFLFAVKPVWKNETTRDLSLALFVGLLVPFAYSLVQYSLLVNRFYIVFLPIVVVLIAFSIDHLKPAWRYITPVLPLVFMWPTWMADVNAFDRRGHGHNLKWVVERTMELNEGEAIVSTDPNQTRTLFELYHDGELPEFKFVDDPVPGESIWMIETHQVIGYQHELGDDTYELIYSDRQPREAIYLLKKY